MNTFEGKIIKIETAGSLSLIQIKTGDVLLKAIVVDTPQTALYLKENQTITVLFKETEVVIGKGINHLVSMQNKIPGVILEIEKDLLLSKITVETSIGTIRSIITTAAVEQLQIKTGDNVTAMIKTNELIISK